MKMKKRLFALPVAVVLALILAVAACALTGCGDNENDTGDTPKYVHGLTTDEYWENNGGGGTGADGALTLASGARYEAEYAVIEGENADAAVGYSGFVRARSSSSNGYVLVRLSHPGNTISFTVTSDKAEENVTLTACIAMLQYGNPWQHRRVEFDSAYNVSVNGEAFPQTGVMFGENGKNGEQYFEMVDVALKIDLSEGNNVITFTVPELPQDLAFGDNPAAYLAPNFDYITITTQSAKMTYSPNYNNAIEKRS